MLDALYISAVGLEAQKEQLDALANNLANVSTTAFKRQSVDFSAVLDRAPAGRSLEGAGPLASRPSSVLLIDQTPGAVRQTGRPLDVAIAGAGFLEVELPGEQTGYSRAGALQVNADGALSLVTGQVLKTDVRVPGDATDVRIQTSGEVTAVLAGDATPTVLGQIELATFANPERLQYRGEGVFTAPEDAEPQHARPGEDGAGELLVQSLEGSNVQMTEEMVSLMLMQRIYELNSRVAQVADEIMGMSNNLRRN